MVFLSGGEVRRVRTTGQATPEVLVRRPTLEGGLPVWSPNDDWILHNAGGWHLVSPDGKTERALSLQADVCAFSRNGLALYCVRNEGLGGILFSRPVADGPERVIAKLSPNSKPATQLNPGPKMTLTPDGEYVTYSVRKREANLWLMAGFH
jgi:hypothetical protein